TPPRRAAFLPSQQQSPASEAQILALVKRQPDLFNATLATVVPQQPSLPVENRIRLVNGVVVPLVLAGTNDGVGSMTFPSADAVLGTGNTDLCVVHVSKADVEHDVPVTLSNDLTGGNAIFLPRILRVGFEVGVVLVPGPFQAVVAGGVADSVGFVLLPTGIPHAIELGRFVVDDVRAHYGYFFPRHFRRQHRLVAHLF